MVFFQRLESVFICLGLLAVYYFYGLNWFTFILFFLVPDVSMIGYLKNPKLGAFIYNLGHSYIVPIVIVVTSSFVNFNFGITLALIWAIHIAFDRTLGFGFKSPTSFQETHLGKLTKRKK